MKRFWAEASVVREDGEYFILLDRKPVKGSDGAALAVPYSALAEAIAAEWAQAGAVFAPGDLPMTQLAAAARNQAPGAIQAELIAYGLNDLLCYRSPEPPALRAREAEVWQPWLDWAAERLGIRLEITLGIAPIPQPEASRYAILCHTGGLDAFEMTGLAVIVPALGSLVLGLAVRAGALSADAACVAASLGELWQEARWGVDAEAAARRRRIAAEVAAAARFMRLCAS